MRRRASPGDRRRETKSDTSLSSSAHSVKCFRLRRRSRSRLFPDTPLRAARHPSGVMRGASRARRSALARRLARVSSHPRAPAAAPGPPAGTAAPVPAAPPRLGPRPPPGVAPRLLRGFAASGGDERVGRGVPLAEERASAGTTTVDDAAASDASARAADAPGSTPPGTPGTSAEVGSSSARKDLYMMFTCGRCETRAAKGFSRQAYDNGVVIVRCPGCQTQHLVADRYGWFGEPGSVEDFLRDRGEVVARTREEGAGVAFLTESEDGTIEADEAAVKAWMDRVKATAVERARAGGEGATDDGRG